MRFVSFAFFSVGKFESTHANTFEWQRRCAHSHWSSRQMNVSIFFSSDQSEKFSLPHHHRRLVCLPVCLYFLFVLQKKMTFALLRKIDFFDSFKVSTRRLTIELIRWSSQRNRRSNLVDSTSPAEIVGESD